MSGLAEALKQHGDFTVSGGYADVYPNIKVGGLSKPAVWLCDYAAPDEPIIVGVTGNKDALSQYIVLGRVGAPGPPEGQVTAAPAGMDTITVTAPYPGGTAYTVTFLDSYVPNVGDRVRLIWQGGSGTVLGKVGITPSQTVAPPLTAPPPTASTNDKLPVVATDSATFSPGYGWNSYYKKNVYQGDGSPWGGPSVNSGAWFYGNGAGQLAGATITAVAFRVPARNSAGSSAPGTIHLYLHDSPARPGGDVNRIAGPVDFTVNPGQTLGWVQLPASWGAALVAGGGIGISGAPYMGYQGRDEDPESGQLQLTWTR